MKKVFVIVCMFIMLTGCIGPTLFTIGGLEITAGSILSTPIKKKVIEQIKENNKTTEQQSD